MGCKNGNSKQNTTKLELNTLKSKVAKVTIKNTEGKYQLLVNNEPFYIKGAGLEFGNIPALAKTTNKIRSAFAK